MFGLLAALSAQICSLSSPDGDRSRTGVLTYPLRGSGSWDLDDAGLLGKSGMTGGSTSGGGGQAGLVGDHNELSSVAGVQFH
jgi:hypothetical protein